MRMHDFKSSAGLLFATIGLIAVFGMESASAAAENRDGGATYATHCVRCHGPSGRTETENARALKVRPLAGDAKLAQMAPADIVAAIRSNAKHRGVGADVDLPDADIEAVARFVKELAGTVR